MWIPQMPSGLLWSHNAFYHPWMLRQVPNRAASALDVGCGAGALASALAQRADEVDGVDADEGMIKRAGVDAPANVRWLRGDILDDHLDLRRAGYDVVTAVASLHHLPLRPALERFAGLVRPGGTLLIVGLYRQASAADYLLDLVALPANFLVGVGYALCGKAGKRGEGGMPVRMPETTLAELRSVAADALPGSVLRRKLFWRYTLIWRRPS